MKTIIKMILLIAFTAILSEGASAQCQRHFYNRSPVSFQVTMSGGLCNGSLYCFIPAGATVPLIYFPQPISYIRIWSSFYNKDFAVSGCYIHHSGSTGGIAVNDPADGDVKTCGGPGWPCQKYGYKP